MKFRAVIFDFDGTLLDTLRDLAESVNAVLSRSGLPQHDLEQYRHFVGEGVEELARRVLPEGHRDKATIANTISAVKEEYRQRWPNNTRPYEGIPELLDELSARRVKMAIVTNKPEDSTRNMAATLLPRWKFDAIVGATPDLPRKPDPTGALEAARRLGLPPEAFLYVGDSDIDMKTANAAGMYAVGALWGFRDADELIKNGAKALISKPLELLDLL
ncbi:MAG: HAD family hydrolase [Dehalococcoidia bacterium]|nr:HAD family hydrolase [Dehalococcoidia bacterium]